MWTKAEVIRCATKQTTKTTHHGVYALQQEGRVQHAPNCVSCPHCKALGGLAPLKTVRKWYGSHYQ